MTGRTLSRSGFTVIELMVALAVSAVSMLLAHEVFSETGARAAQVRAARTRLDRRANAERWLSAAFLSVEIGTDGSSFAGKSDQAGFSAFLLTRKGWRERRAIDLQVHEGWLMGRADSAEVRLLPADSAAFDYLLEPGECARWVGTWSSAATAPLAVRLRLATGTDRDTMLFLIRPRG